MEFLNVNRYADDTFFMKHKIIFLGVNFTFILFSYAECIRDVINTQLRNLRKILNEQNLQILLLSPHNNKSGNQI